MKRPREVAHATLLLAALARPGSVLAATDEPELVTDRPDQTESTVVVPTGRVQIELGATATGDEAGKVEDELDQLGGTLVRIGLGRWFELRVGWQGWLDQDTTTAGERSSDDGAGDAELGAKLRLREGHGTSPAVAVLVSTSVPVGEEPFSSERFDPSVRLSLSHELPGGIGLGWNLGVDADSERVPHGGRATLATALYTVSAGFPAGERVAFFAEAFGDLPLSAEGGPAHSLDAGVTYLVRPNLQLDLAGGAGLSADAADWFAGFGVSLRLPR